MKADNINPEIKNWHEDWDGACTIALVLGLVLIGIGIFSHLVYRYGWFEDSFSVTHGYWAFLFFSIPGVLLFIVPFDWNLRATVVVACVGIGLNLWVGYYSTDQINKAVKSATDEIQEALYPNNFRVQADIQNIESEDEWADSTPWIPPTYLKGGKHFPFYPLISDSGKMLLRIIINNESKYPANMVPFSIYVCQGDSGEDDKKFTTLLQSLFPNEFFYDPSSITTTINGKQVVLKGVRFFIRQIPGKEDLTLAFFPIALKKKTGLFAVVLRDSIFAFNISLKE
jgi:hypothetical protein